MINPSLLFKNFFLISIHLANIFSLLNPLYPLNVLSCVITTITSLSYISISIISISTPPNKNSCTYPLLSYLLFLSSCSLCLYYHQYLLLSLSLSSILYVFPFSKTYKRRKPGPSFLLLPSSFSFLSFSPNNIPVLDG